MNTSCVRFSMEMEMQEFGVLSKEEEEELQQRILRASLEDQTEWEKKYKKEMASAIQFFTQKLAEDDSKWTLVSPADPADSVSLFQQDTASGYYILKAVGTLKCRADRLYYINTDTNFATRQLWDGEDVKHIEQITEYCCNEAKIQVVQTIIRVPAPLVSDRFSLGIQWHGYNPKNQTYRVVFKTTNHFFASCPNDLVPVSSISGIWIRALESKGKEHFCECAVVAYVHPGGSLPAWLVNLFKEKLRKRLHLYEQVVQNWNQYYKGKNPRKVDRKASDPQSQ